ncbi:branched-chain amino acid transporter permease [Marinospirillum insulare]|uniref:Branched-chain amino acid transporter AzlD n=1 Tax=Marinospirillum insulare TaxID=217169 RepID=A0ABQ6A179_9GAMM|nr:AzlD domain-containing protein [Marinospirillum insulare]GLR64008.1 branched-chain amino acid transporter AzlD [Marinospirillum insulare]
MSNETLYLVSFILVTAVATFLTRLMPFAFLGKHSNHPLAQHLGRYLPAGIMAVLVAIFLPRAAHWQTPVFGLDALLPAALVIVLHLWRRNALLSMLAGTICYMAIQQGVINLV